jgi:hypothetical protein
MIIIISHFHLIPVTPNSFEFLFLSGFLAEIICRPVFVISAHLILLYFMALVIYGEEYELGNTSLCIFSLPPVTSSLEPINISLSNLVSNCSRQLPYI